MGWTTKQAADELGVTLSFVTRLCRYEILKSTMHGRDWDIDPDSVKEYKEKSRKRGRPSKTNKPLPSPKKSPE
jgi:excisionase family DNA binding protein